MRRAARVDDNQPAVVKKLREAGATVQPLHAVGDGCPDLLVGYRGENILLEVKDGSKPPSKRKLTDDQIEWHGSWSGRVYVVNSPDDALECIWREGRFALRATE